MLSLLVAHLALNMELAQKLKDDLLKYSDPIKNRANEENQNFIGPQKYYESE